MAAILLGYFATMATVFAAIMYFLASIVDAGSAHHLRAQPYRMSVAPRAMVAERMAAERIAAQRVAANTPGGTVATAAPTHAPDTVAANTSPAVGSGTHSAERQVHMTSQVKLARDEKYRVRLASRSLNQGYAALGYAPESPTRIAANRIFSSINSRR